MIRKLIPEPGNDDFSKLLAVYLEFFNAPDVLKFLSYTRIPFTQSQVETWLHTYAESGIGYYAAYEEDGSISGLAISKSDAIQGFEILGLVVRTERRKTGTGKKLITFLVNEAYGEGYRSVDVTVFADNAAMLRLVLSLGFIPVRMAYHVRSDGADIVVLKKYLE